MKTPGVKSLTGKIILSLGSIALLLGSIIFVQTYYQTRKQLLQMAEQQTSLALSFGVAIRSYVATNIRPAIRDSHEEGYFNPRTMSTSFIARSIFNQVREEFPDYIIKFSAANPRNPVNLAETEELAIIEHFRQDETLKSWSGELTMQGHDYLASFTAQRAKESCLVCHGDPTAAPSYIIEKYGDKGGFHLPLGEVIALNMVAVPMNRIHPQLLPATIGNFIIFGLAFAFFSLATGLILHFLVTHRLHLIAQHFSKATKGEKFREIGPLHLSGNDEISLIGENFNRLEIKLDNYYLALEEKVNERTSALLDSNLRLQKEVDNRRQAEADNRELQSSLERAHKMEALGTLAGGVAHDLNNILSALTAYPDLLLRKLPPDSSLRKPLTTIKTSGLKAAAIVQDLLTLSRRGLIQQKVLNLNQIINEFLKSPEYHNLCRDYPQITHSISLAPNLYNLSGSESHLEKTIMNLVSNALEAMTDEKGQLIISTENCLIDQALCYFDQIAAGEYVLLKIEDTGSGIADKDLDKIFEPFYTTKEMGRTSGTGLGMAVVWGTVKDHGGFIDVDSRLGEGTLFSLYFPATQEMLYEKPEDKLTSLAYGRGEKILVVDDTIEQREINSTILTELGYQVNTAHNGSAALDFLKSNQVELVLLDMIMEPGLDGLNTYIEILKLHPDQKAIIISGFSETKRVREALRLGAGYYLQKPYTTTQLLHTVRTELNAERKNRAQKTSTVNIN